jgi:hypothetical protein
MVEIVRSSKGRPSNLSDRERKELQSLLAKVEPRELVKRVATTGFAARFRKPRLRESGRPVSGAAAGGCRAYLSRIRRNQTFTARESRWMPTLRLTRCSALSTVFVSHSSRSPITSYE